MRTIISWCHIRANDNNMENWIWTAHFLSIYVPSFYHAIDICSVWHIYVICPRLPFDLRPFYGHSYAWYNYKHCSEPAITEQQLTGQINILLNYSYLKILTNLNKTQHINKPLYTGIRILYICSSVCPQCSGYPMALKAINGAERASSPLEQVYPKHTYF